MFCDPNIYYRTRKPMSRDIQWVQFYDICAVVAPGLISISEGAMSKVTTIRWCRGLPFRIELISRLMSWTAFVSDDGRLVYFQEAGLRSWKVPDCQSLELCRMRKGQRVNTVTRHPLSPGART